ncbi:MAG: aminotransferase class III-fold pyridoxal phosphate-dependent enzyme [Ilumatobacteraceae bacterium]
MTVLDTRPDDAYANDRAHVFHSWSIQGALAPPVVTRAEGSHFWTADGSKYLDFSSQLVNVNIGHQHPKLVAAIQEQAARLCTIAPSFANDARSEAARLICEAAAVNLDGCDLDQGVLHQRRRRGHRERGAHGSPAHRPVQGAQPLPQLPRRHQRGHHR